MYNVETKVDSVVVICPHTINETHSLVSIDEVDAVVGPTIIEDVEIGWLGRPLSSTSQQLARRKAHHMY